MIRILALYITRHANYFPAATGISKHFSPLTIVSKKQVNYNKELVYSFGDYVQANEDSNPKNNNLQQPLYCIYLQWADSLQGGHELMDLATVELIQKWLKLESSFLRGVRVIKV